MPRIINRDGKEFAFPDDYTDEQIEAFFNTETVASNEVKEQPSEEKAESRGIITDTPVQVAGGVADMAKSSLHLLEGIGQDLKRKYNVGGFTFGDNAKNGFVQYHTYDDVIKNNIKLPVSGNPEVIGDSAFEQFIPDVDEADTKTGAVVRSVSQFLSGWTLTAPLKPLKVVKGASSAVNLAKVSTRGAVADFVAFDSDTGRFVDMVNQEFPGLQNPLFDYLSSEDKDEGFYEARFKNAVEGVLLGYAGEKLIRAGGFLKNQIVDTAKWIKLKRKELTGAQNADASKLKAIQDKINRDAEINSSYAGKQANEKLKNKIIEDADSELTKGVVSKIKDKASNKELSEKIASSFRDYQDRVLRHEKTIRSGGKLNFRNIEGLDLELSPRAYADTDFGIIALDAIQKAIRNENRFVNLSPGEIEKMASKLSGDPIQTTKMMGQLGKKLEEGHKWMYLSDQIQQSLADAIYKMSASLTSGSKEYTEQQLAVATSHALKLAGADIKVASNLGRGLGLRRILKDQNMDMSSEEILRYVKELPNYKGDFKAWYNNVAKVRDTGMIQRMFDFTFRNKWWNKLNEVWMASALSNPKTQIINFASTAVNMWVKPAQTWLGSKMTWGLDDYTKGLMKNRGAEAVATMTGYKQYMSDAVQFMKKAFNDEDSVLFAGSTKFDTNTKALGTGKIARGIRYPLRGLTAVDEFFKQVSYRARLKAIASREALEEGKSVTKIVGKTPDGRDISEYDEYVFSRFAKGFDEAGLTATDKEASIFAQEVTFTKDLDGILGYIQNMVNEVPILKQIMPFVKTPANLAMQAVEMTPLGLVGKNWKYATGKSSDALRIAEVRGKVAMGTGILSLATLLSYTGLITGGYHPDRNIKKLQQKKGIQPYSIKIGDTYIEYGRLDPIGMLIGLIADFATIYPELNEKDRMDAEKKFLSFMVNQMAGNPVENLSGTDKFLNIAEGGYKAIYRNIASKTYLKGLIDFLSAVDGSNENGRFFWWLKSKGSSYVPNIIAKVNNDPFLRDTQAFVDMLKKKVGSTNLMKQYNYMGEPVENTQGYMARVFNSLINPFTIKGEKEDFVLKNSIEHEINIPPIDKVVKGVDLTLYVNPDTGQTAWEYFNEQVGESNLRSKIERKMKSEKYKNAPNKIIIDENNKFGGRFELINRIVTKERKRIFRRIELSGDFVSKQNPNITLASHYRGLKRIKRVGKITNKYPKSATKGVYDFIDQTR